MGPVLQEGQRNGEVRTDLELDELVDFLVEQTYLAAEDVDRSEEAVRKRFRHFVVPALEARDGDGGELISRTREVENAISDRRRGSAESGRPITWTSWIRVGVMRQPQPCRSWRGGLQRSAPLLASRRATSRMLCRMVRPTSRVDGTMYRLSSRLNRRKNHSARTGSTAVTAVGTFSIHRDLHAGAAGAPTSHPSPSPAGAAAHFARPSRTPLIRGRAGRQPGLGLLYAESLVMS